MKAKLLKYITVFSILSFFVAGVANAQSPLDSAWKQLGHAAQGDGANYGDPMDPRLIVANIVKLSLTLIATILFALCVYAGYQWMTAQGNDEQIAKAKKTIVNSTIGLIVILASYGITIVITNLAVGRSLNTRTTTGSQLDSLFK
jgi:hypothetical protein